MSRAQSGWAVVLCLLAVVPASVADEPWTDLTHLQAWQEPTRSWALAGSVQKDAGNHRRLTFVPGQGILVNGKKGEAADLVSKDKYGDVQVHLEFLIPEQSNSGVKLHGHYEIQICDSHGKKTVDGSDCGGIYPRAELRPVYHHIDKGIAPRSNAARAAGAWQSLDITFQAPRFDRAGKKTANARFIKVILNGQVIHDNVEVATPTGHAWHNKEMAAGPLLLQGDHGPVAFRNVRVRPWKGARAD
jgi:hypothetical protein